MNSPADSADRRLAVVLGAGALGLALVPWRWLLERSCSTDGRIEFLPFGLLLLTARAVLALLGAGLLVVRPSRRGLGRLGLALAATLLALLGGELLARAAYQVPGRTWGWKSSYAAAELNQLGYRGQPIEYGEHDLVIVLLGDSQVEARACAYGWMPERRLQHHLRQRLPHRPVKVFTLGTGGYGQDQELLALQQYFRNYRADLVICWHIFNNDVWNNIFPTHWTVDGWPKPTFRLVDGQLLAPRESLGDPLTMRSAVRLLDLLVNAWRLRRDLDAAWEPWLPPAYQPLEAYTGTVNTTWQYQWDHNMVQMRHEDLPREKSHWAVWLAPRSPRMQYGLDLTRALFGKIAELTTAQGGRFAILTHHTPHELSMREEVYLLNNRYYRVSPAQYRLNLAAVTEGFLLFDVPVTVDEWRYGPEDAHLNEHAVDQVMEDLAARLAEVMRARGWVGPRATTSAGTTAAP